MRLFTPVGSNLTDAWFFVPGSNGTTRRHGPGLWRRFTDVDAPDGLHHVDDGASTQLEYFDVDGKLLFSGVVPASPGDGSLSFFGIVFHDARIAAGPDHHRQRRPGPDDDAKHDIVMMDDFLYGEPQEPQPLPAN